MKQLIHLEVLHVGNNQINEIRYSDIKSLENLREFYMDGCYRDSARGMRVYPDAFKENIKLRTISITKCDGLKKIEDNTFSLLTDLHMLNLHGNGIESIEANAIDFSTLEWFDLSGNPIQCTCKIEPWLPQIRKLNEKSISKEYGDIPTVRCAEPNRLAGRAIGELTSNDINCNEGDLDGMSSVAVVLTTVAVLIVFLALLVIAVYYYRKTVYSRNHRSANSGVHSTLPPKTPSSLFGCFGGNRPPTRRGRVKRPSQQHILKKDITVETIPLSSKQLPQGWKDVEVSVEQLSDEGIYECFPEDLPVGPSNANYPDVKVSVI